MSADIKRYDLTQLPYNENLDRFAPDYFPESFTEEEQNSLKPFFSNIDKPIFVMHKLPEEIMGALCSRYSRSTKSIRRTFLDEYVKPIINPQEETDESLLMAFQFKNYIKYLNQTKGLDDLVNIQRARKFFDKWLSEYGDDSIAELGGVHLCLEGISNLVMEEIVNSRVNLPLIVKSSRYVSYAEKRLDHNYQYVVPGELKGTPLEQEYKDVMDLLFATYDQLLEPYLEYIKDLYPKGDDETDGSFKNSRSAKRFDDIRELLPFATQNNLALYGNGRSYENLINRLLSSQIGECRWIGQTICKELNIVVPSFVKRPQTERGAEVQVYKNNLNLLGEELKSSLAIEERKERHNGWVKLISFTPNADIEVLTTFLFANQDKYSLGQIREKIKEIKEEERYELLGKILSERNFGKQTGRREVDRFKKPHRAFENAHYLFSIFGRAGDFRDLHRQRMLTEGHQRFTTKWGFNIEEELRNSPFIDKVAWGLHEAANFYEKLEKISPEIAQYVVPFAYVQHWYMNISAREIYWMVELRTGPQGRPHYREICQQIAQEAIKTSPAIFQGLMVDMNDYRLARRESEKKRSKKLGEL